MPLTRQPQPTRDGSNRAARGAELAVSSSSNNRPVNRATLVAYRADGQDETPIDKLCGTAGRRCQGQDRIRCTNRAMTAEVQHSSTLEYTGLAGQFCKVSHPYPHFTRVNLRHL
ncbi:unnamed protein product [Calypogeia fissa]